MKCERCLGDIDERPEILNHLIGGRVVCETCYERFGTWWDGARKHGAKTGIRACKCDLCTAASREYQRAQRKKRPPLEPDDRRHGSVNAYCNWHCRCDACAQAMRDYAALLRERKKAAEQ